MSILDDLLRTLRAPLDFVRGKTSSVRSVEGRAQGDVMRIKNLPQEFKGELDYNKQLVKDYGRRAKNAKNYATGQRGPNDGSPGQQNPQQQQGGKKKMGLFSKKRRCAGCNEKLDARWELCPYCGFGGNADAGGQQHDQGQKPRTMALDIGNQQNNYAPQNNYPPQQNNGGGGGGNKPRTMALDIGSMQAQQSQQRASTARVAWIIPLDGPQGGQLLELHARAIVGTAPDCDVVVKDPSVSGRHAEFSAQNGVFRVNDLGSTNGTFVNDKRVQGAELVDGDTLRLGRTPFKFKST